MRFNAWVLWAQSATACGNNLTQDCVLQKAGHTDVDGRRLFRPVNTEPGLHDYPTALLFMRLTTTGWVYRQGRHQTQQWRLQLRSEQPHRRAELPVGRLTDQLAPTQLALKQRQLAVQMAPSATCASTNPDSTSAASTKRWTGLDREKPVWPPVPGDLWPPPVLPEPDDMPRGCTSRSPTPA